MSRFERAMQRMNKAITSQLNDGIGEFVDGNGTVRQGLHLMIDSKIEMAGVVEMLTGGIKAVTVRVPELCGSKPSRGGVFKLNQTRYIVEDTLTDDGYFATYACMEQRP
ncbi:hypothetical protein [Denitrificimonas caeni]|uniref:hypothetical protein n=1 Tax=Denitrificimonas caeni TaxID=521720 RepID=UPI001965E82A|nr:hypothetical protein [Denitrificimonas caeni]